jgi:ribA/ribD-fused uncharacterized protein
MVFSNFHPCTIDYNDKKFSSVEQAFQYTKAEMLEQKDIAEQILQTDNPREIKKIANKLNDEDRAWQLIRYDVMKELISIKTETCPEFKTALLESEDKNLAEATGNLFWASGLNPQLTNTTNPDYYPGKNKLGQILMNQRAKLSGNVTYEKEKNKDQIKTSTEQNTNHQSRTLIKKQDIEKRSSSLPTRTFKLNPKSNNDVSHYFSLSQKRPSIISPNKETDQKEKYAKKN